MQGLLEEELFPGIRVAKGEYRGFLLVIFAKEAHENPGLPTETSRNDASSKVHPQIPYPVPALPQEQGMITRRGPKPAGARLFLILSVN